MGWACRPNPKWEAAANKLEIKKRTKSAAEAPGPGSCFADATSAAPAPFVGRGPRPGPQPRHRLPAEGRIFCRSEGATGAGAEAALVTAEPEDELSKFR